MSQLAPNGGSVTVWLQMLSKDKHYVVREWLVNKADRSGLNEFLGAHHEFHDFDQIALSRIEDLRGQEKHTEVRGDLQALKPAPWWKDKRMYFGAFVGAFLAWVVRRLIG